MNLIQRFNTIFNRLIISFILIVVMMTLLLGTIILAVISRSYSREIEDINSNLLLNLKKELDAEIFDKTSRLSFEITTNKHAGMDVVYLFNNEAASAMHKVISSVNFLKDLVYTNSDVLESIYLYYNACTLIISDKGFAFLDEHEYSDYMDKAWLSLVEETNNRLVWLKTRKISTIGPNGQQFESSVASFIRFYPYGFSSDTTKGNIVLNIKERSIRTVLRKYLSSAQNFIVLLDPSGNIISHSDEKNLYESTAELQSILHLLDASPAVGSMSMSINQVRSIVSYTKLDSNDYRVISVIPEGEFYEKYYLLRSIMYLVCVAAVVFGIIAAGLLTRNLYSPLKNIVKRAKIAINMPDQLSHRNEYDIINDTISGLSVRLTELDAALIANIPLIKHRCIENLLKGNMKSEDDLNKKLQLCGFCLSGSIQRAIVIKIMSDQLGSQADEQYHHVKYRMIEDIESSSGADQFIAIDIEDDHLAVIASINDDQNKCLLSSLQDIRSIICEEYGYESTCSVGVAVDEPLKLSASYQSACTMLKYSYFNYDCAIIEDGSLLDRELSESTIPDNLFDKYISAISAGYEQEIDETVTAILAAMDRNQCSFDYCHKRLNDMVHLFLEHVKNIDYGRYKEIETDICSEFDLITDAGHFKRWLIERAVNIYRHESTKYRSRRSEKIVKIKKYIRENLDNIDENAKMSLGTIAEMAGLNPQYFCKIFKEETGMNYTDFVNQEKLAKARDLILESKYTIAMIAQRLGYSSSAYFIKRFRARYGMTPGEYCDRFTVKINKV